MAQPVKKGKNIVTKRNKVKKNVKRKHKEYGTSKLEEKFSKEFLERLGIKYIYQFKAESIGRYFDFYLPEVNLIVEIDGDYWHAYGLVYEEMNPTQKKNTRVDRQKDEWALSHGIPIIRIWEHDIINNQDKVLKYLKSKVGIYREKYEKEIDKKKRH